MRIIEDGEENVTCIGNEVGKGTANGTNSPKASLSPKTGDQAAIMAWILAAMFAACIGVFVIERKRSAQ